jgi:cell division protein FtsL
MTLAQPTPAAQPSLEVIPGAAKRRQTKIGHWIVFALAVMVAFFGLIYSRISLDDSAFEIQDLEAQIAVQEELHWQLRYELAQIQDPALLDAQIADLGMVYPEERVALSVPIVGVDELDPDYRWAQLKAILSAQP